MPRATAAVSLLLLPPAVRGWVAFTSCFTTVAKFADVSGTRRSSPCPAEVYSAGEPLGGGKAVFACGTDGAYVCGGFGIGPTADVCEEMRGSPRLGCRARVADVAVQWGMSGPSRLFVACGSGVAADSMTRCEWNATAEEAYDCQPLLGNHCPSNGIANGVAIGSSGEIVLSCSIANLTVPSSAGVFKCTGALSSSSACAGFGGAPCVPIPGGSWIQGAAHYDRGGKLIVGCMDAPVTAAVCLQYTSVSGAQGCSAVTGPAPPCNQFIAGVTETPSGHTAAACLAEGYYLCNAPAAVPTGAPASPTASPAAPVAPSGSPSGASSAPSNAPPSAAPAAEPSAAPTAQPAPGPSVAPSSRPAARPGQPSASPAAAASPTAAPTASPVSSPSGAPTRPPSSVPSRAALPTAPPTHAAPSHGGPSAPPGLRVQGSPPPPPPRSVPPPHRPPSLSPPPPPAASDPGGAECLPPELAALCAALGCQGRSTCRAASSCVPVPGGLSYCLVGAAAPDGTACTDGRAATVGDVCAGGACVGLPRECAVTAECLAAADYACATFECRAGKCHRMAANDGRECDDRRPHTARDVCSSGVCSGVDLCRGVDCAQAEQCRERGLCRHADGGCERSPRPDGERCLGRGPSSPALSSRCLGGECLAFATLRVAELTLVDASGARLQPVTAFAPESPAAGVRLACAAADADTETDWVDAVAAEIPSPAAGGADGELMLPDQSGTSHGAVVLLFGQPVAAARLVITDSASGPAQAPTRLRLSGCALADAAALKLSRQGGLCGGAARGQGELGVLQRELSAADWVTIQLSAATEGPDALQRTHSVAAQAEHMCYQVKPLALRGCGTSCEAGSTGFRIQSREGAGVLTLVLMAVGSVLVGFALGCRFSAGQSAEPPPLTGGDLDSVLRQCSDCCAALASCWWRGDASVTGELAAGLRAPDGGAAAAERLRRMLRQPWCAAAAADPQLGALPPAALLALRLYSMAPQDADREMGWPDAPGGVTAPDGHSPALASSSGSRNPCVRQLLEKAYCGVSRRPYLSALHGEWIKCAAAVSWAAGACRPTAVCTGGYELVCMFGNLPGPVRTGYDALRYGDYFALPSLSVCAASPKADGRLMGAHPGYAVLLRLRFSAGTAVGVSMSTVSTTSEEGVLVPVYTVFRVAGVRRPRRLHGEVALPPAAGCAGTAARALLRARAALRPLLVIEADCVGPLRELDPGAAEWHAAVGRDAQRLSSALLAERGARECGAAWEAADAGPARSGAAAEPAAPLQPLLEEQTSAEEAAPAAQRRRPLSGSLLLAAAGTSAGATGADTLSSRSVPREGTALGSVWAADPSAAGATTPLLSAMPGLHGANPLGSVWATDTGRGVSL